MNEIEFDYEILRRLISNTNYSIRILNKFNGLDINSKQIIERLIIELKDLIYLLVTRIDENLIKTTVCYNNKKIFVFKGYYLKSIPKKVNITWCDLLHRQNALIKLSDKLYVQDNNTKFIL